VRSQRHTRLRVIWFCLGLDDAGHGKISYFDTALYFRRQELNSSIGMQDRHPAKSAFGLMEARDEALQSFPCHVNSL
jgi:hypothetical protein